MPAEREAVGQVRRHADIRHRRGLPEGSPAARSTPARVRTVRRLRRASQGEDGIGGAAGIKLKAVSIFEVNLWDALK